MVVTVDILRRQSSYHGYRTIFQYRLASYVAIRLVVLVLQWLRKRAQGLVKLHQKPGAFREMKVKNMNQPQSAKHLCLSIKNNNLTSFQDC